MEIYTLGSMKTNYLGYVEVPWLVRERRRSDIDCDGERIKYLRDECGNCLRDKETGYPMGNTSNGSTVVVPTEVWVERSVFTTPFGPCCLSEEDLPHDKPAIVCGGKCCYTSPMIRIDDQYRILEHLSGIQQHLPALNRMLISEVGPFQDEMATKTPEGACIFWRRQDGKCAIHVYAQETGIDWHNLKPLPCVLFPLSIVSGRQLDEQPGARFFVRIANPGAVQQHGIRCPIGSEQLLPAYLNMRDEMDFFFGTGFHETLCDAYSDFQQHTLTTEEEDANWRS
jgi:Fe-S-cluster containining protein